MKHNNITIRDVAELAGVSSATVSYVLSGNPRKTISAETIKRVFEAAGTLGYVKKKVNRGVRDRKYCIGVATNQVRYRPRFTRVLNGISDQLIAKGYRAVLCSAGENGEGTPDFLEAYFKNQVDGIIFVSMAGGVLKPGWEDMIIERSVPFLVHDCEPNYSIPSVDIDYLSGAYQMTEAMIKKGCADIHFFYPDTNLRQERDRMQGVKKAVYDNDGATLTIHSYPTLLSDPAGDASDDVLASMTLTGVLNRMEEELHQIVGGTTERTAFIGVWDGMEGPLMKVVRHESRLPNPIGILAQGSRPDELRDNLFYSYLPSYDIGKVCALGIVQLVEGSGPVSRVTLVPSISDPAYKGQ